jgi:alkylation response protein AidB-like acyl-CoA dehydrogenase
MDFNYTEEQSLLRDSVAGYLGDRYGFDDRQKVVKSEAGWRPEVWQAFAEELGILGAPFSEEHGGLGGGPIENMIIMEEIGKNLVVEPYLGTVVIGGGFLKHSGYAGAADVIGGVIGGTNILAFAYAEPQARYTWHDLKTTARKDGEGYVLNGHKAVVIGRALGHAPDRHGAHRRRPARLRRRVGVPGRQERVRRGHPRLPDRRRPARVGSLLRERVGRGRRPARDRGGGMPLVERVMDEAIAAVCSEAVGCMRKLHEGTLDYARQRKQFGVPIASFQVLQHRMVDMFINLEQSVSMTLMATIKLDESDEERMKSVSAAKVQIGRACKFVGQNAIQIHGGMGMTDELAIGHYFKRATMIEGQFGSVDHHLRRYEDLSLGKAA